MCLLLNPQKDTNHLHIIIKLTLNTVPRYVTTPVQLQVTLCKTSVVQCSRKTGSCSALVFLSEVFVHTSVTASNLSIGTPLNNKYRLVLLQTLID